MTIDYIHTQSRNRGISYHSGLKKYLISVYQYVAVALALTAIIAMGAASSQESIYAIYSSGLKWIIAFAPLIGLSLLSIFIGFTGESITRVFFITASTFGAISIYGHNTKKDLSSMESFLMMGVAGLFISGVINIFLKSLAIYFISSVIGIVVFTVLTAYDTQRVKELYSQNQGSEGVASKFAIYGSLTLYMHFINLFIFLLQLLGVRRSDEERLKTTIN